VVVYNAAPIQLPSILPSKLYSLLQLAFPLINISVPYIAQL